MICAKIDSITRNVTSLLDLLCTIIFCSGLFSPFKNSRRAYISVLLFASPLRKIYISWSVGLIG